MTYYSASYSSSDSSRHVKRASKRASKRVAPVAQFRDEAHSAPVSGELAADRVGAQSYASDTTPVTTAHNMPVVTRSASVGVMSYAEAIVAKRNVAAQARQGVSKSSSFDITPALSSCSTLVNSRRASSHPAWDGARSGHAAPSSCRTLVNSRRTSAGRVEHSPCSTLVSSRRTSTQHEGDKAYADHEISSCKTLIPCPRASARHLIETRILDALRLTCSRILSAVKDKTAESCKRSAQMSQLPPELIMMICTRLDAKSLSRVAATCRSWRSVSSSNLLWKPFYCRDHRQIPCDPCSKRWGMNKQAQFLPCVAVHDLAAPVRPLSVCPTVQSEPASWKQLYIDRAALARNWQDFRHEEKVYEFQGERATCVKLCGDLIVAGFSNGRIGILPKSFTPETKMWYLPGHKSEIQHLHVDMDKIVSASVDGITRVWCVRTGELTLELPPLFPHLGPVVSISVLDNQVAIAYTFVAFVFSLHAGLEAQDRLMFNQPVDSGSIAQVTLATQVGQTVLYILRKEIRLSSGALVDSQLELWDVQGNVQLHRTNINEPARSFVVLKNPNPNRADLIMVHVVGFAPDAAHGMKPYHAHTLRSLAKGNEPRDGAIKDVCSAGEKLVWLKNDMVLSLLPVNGAAAAGSPMISEAKKVTADDTSVALFSSKRLVLLDLIC